MMGLNRPGYSSFAFCTTFTAKLKFLVQFGWYKPPPLVPITNINCAAYSSPIFTLGA